MQGESSFESVYRVIGESSFESVYRVIGEPSGKEWLCIGIYDAPLPEENEYDRIHLMITADGAQKGWLMTPHEAEMIAQGLMMVVDRAKKGGWYDEV